ncbi:hypothetical protein CO115_00240 [Candidatus Falkowbacteria bacterium CG_4_9_14_3_um_filter_36_9]|uniref:DUF3048 domain-containing protein n=1 Tax=Candidatus Falkowbacteria bacterium CG02_land_8_20_14_3_00_36_14 TaxID=1974560 RepID=A0A2M7DPD6_9BACT|nr:MAG: hypothetical protein COS18_02365 [Candidatus Falkowbacteria bacterium CG02_land_8_20_14_3_00_36_14]PIX11494.1 MAG: hypothetical protein COZ73_02490 [Candidatus Falkowbacteria bacterium CG_4_8_14_3_um_filter_36_11]PJA10662.1 MAG: hypothetical protein COX67_03845 [Candidatus Falkowbacteria bacterium CG_4_10_14_0_2_um_filter_36_22]PJB20809.1 MAG: hypothetical protein CO115_00240 [Candidatus Falkowbacteria bacterium CG_4_9_14_3_um_filter_36_9]
MEKKDKIENNIIQKKQFWIITSFVFLCLVIVLSIIIFYLKYDYFNKPVIIDTPAENIKKSADNINTCLDCVRRQLDGVYVPAGEANLPLYAVMIENQIDARPQSGIAQAILVFEAEAEGGITRFLAVFDSLEKIDEIGPVRSVRPYFIDWANELAALLVHVGGSPEALVKISQENIFDINEFYNGKYFWRKKTNSAPHNVYTNTANIKEFIGISQKDGPNFFSWQFKNDLSPEARPNINEIKIFYKSYYNVVWKYNQESNDYARYLDGQVHADISGEAIKAKNVIIKVVKAEVLDDELRLRMENIGEGKSIICLDGACQEGVWRKKNNFGRTRFFDKNNEEIIFNAGHTWVEIARPEIKVEY